jgi:SAM-dependent methyltransferase
VSTSGEQHWTAAAYERNARFVSELGLPVVDLLAPRPGERILDLGCGDGALTAALVAAGASVVGLDAAPDFVAAARARGLDVRRLDAQRFDLDETFDAVFSNAALHWMPDAAGVVAGVARVLVPGGRFVGEFGGHGNVAAIRVALATVLGRRGIDAGARSPWYFPTAAEYRAELEAAGFAVVSIASFARPTPLPTGMAGWLETFAQTFFAQLAPDERRAARDETVALLEPVLRDAAGRWTADYVRLRFAATRPD